MRAHRLTRSRQQTHQILYVKKTATNENPIDLITKEYLQKIGIDTYSRISKYFLKSVVRHWRKESDKKLEEVLTQFVNKNIDVLRDFYYDFLKYIYIYIEITEFSMSNLLYYYIRIHYLFYIIYIFHMFYSAEDGVCACFIISLSLWEKLKVYACWHCLCTYVLYTWNELTWS